MTSPNAPSSSAESSSQKSGSKMSMIELLSDVTETRVFDDLHNEAELLKKIQNSPGEVTSEIRQDMKERLLRNPSEFENFTEKDINDGAKLSDKTILEKLRLLLLSTTKAQEKLRNKVVGMYDGSTFDSEKPTGKDNREELDKWIEGKNENEIQRLIKSPAFLRKNLRRHFGEKIETFVRRESVFFIEKLGLKITDLDEGDKACIYRLQLGGGLSIGQNTQGQRLEAPDFVDVRRLLLIIDKGAATSSEKTEVKRDIIREYLPSITPKLLTDLGILTEDEARDKVKKGLEKVFGDDYFTTGTDDEKKERKRFLDTTFKKGWYIEVPIDEYLKDDAFVKRLIVRSATTNTALTENIHDEIKDLANEMTEMKYDMGNMKISPDAKGNWHESFIENIKTLNTGGKQKVKNPENFQKGSYFRVVQSNENGEKKYGYYRIIDTDIELGMPSEIRGPDGFPVKHRGIRVEDWTEGDGMVTPGNQSEGRDQRYGLTYDLFARSDTEVEILTESEMTTRRSKDYEGEDRIKTVYTEKDSIDTLDKLTEGLGWKPEVGKIYSTNGENELGEFFVEIRSIDEGTGTLKISDGVGEFDISFSKFLEINGELKMKDIGDYTSEESVTKLIQTISGFEGVFVKDGKIQKTIKDEHGKDKNIMIEHFMNEEGEGMSIGNISGGNATIHYGKVKDWEEKKGKVNLGKFPGSSYSSSIVKVLTELRENEYKPYENPKDQVEIDTESHLPHSHGSIWGKIMNGTSISDMMKGFDLYKHAWEHKLEKNSKFQSAKFADKYLRKLMPEGFSYQLRSEAYAAQNEAMEGILKMLENDMSGKEARLYVRKKILLNDDAKFEEVLAGLLYISKKTGQLYPEELSDLKNSELWFYKLAVTQGYNTKASRANLRAKCISKSDKVESGQEAVSEMDLVERQLKYWEGLSGNGKLKVGLPPNVAPKFPGALSEGMQSNKEKGEKEVNQRTGIKQMNKYALSKLNVGEAYKVIGCIDRIHTKNGSPMELNQIPFTILMSNMPEYMGSEFRKMLHGEGNGDRASHAFKFGNELPYVRTYRSVVMKAARELDRRKKTGGTIAGKLEKIEAKRREVGNEYHGADTEDPQKKWINSIFDFWGEYGDELQPILQLSDTFISAMASQGDTDCKNYQQRYVEQSAMQNGNIAEKIYENANVGEGNMVANHTPFYFTNLASASFRGINYQNGMMNRKESVYGKIFTPGVLGALEKLRNLKEEDIPPGLTLDQVRKQRFQEYYAALVYYMRRYQTNPPEIMIGGALGGDRVSKRADYMLELDKFGLKFEKRDFRSGSQTTPIGVEITKDGTHSTLNLDLEDQRRCDEMYEAFKRSSASVMSETQGKVGSKIKWGESFG